MSCPTREPWDLLCRADSLWCGVAGAMGPGAVAVRSRRIVAAGPEVSGPTRRELYLPGCTLLPGLVDPHVHAGPAFSRYGVDAAWLLACGTTAALSQGDAGADTWRGYRTDIVEPAPILLRMALNLGRRGERGPEGALADPDLADPDKCAASFAAGDPALWGIAVNTSVPSCGGADPRAALRRALRAAGRAGVPLLVGTRRHPDWSLDDQLEWLRPGDVVTYAFHPLPEGILDERGRVRRSVWKARERGIRFDLGHGRGSFSFAVAERALADGFAPDTLSTDAQRGHESETPRHDLPRVISKLLAAGMERDAAFRAVTLEPARVLGLEDECGSLLPGRRADLVYLGWNPAATLQDVLGLQRVGGCWEVRAVVAGGDVVRPLS